MSAILPFLTTVTTGVKPLASALPQLGGSPKVSPWSPNGAIGEPAAPAPDVEALRAEACERGRADGLRETEELRARLRTLVDALEATRVAQVEPAAELIADVATAIVVAWSEQTDRAALFAPIVRSWIARCPGPAIAHVHPVDLDAIRAAVADAPIAIEPDERVARGNLKITGASFEIAHDWATRIGELRAAIASALEAAP